MENNVCTRHLSAMTGRATSRPQATTFLKLSGRKSLELCPLVDVYFFLPPAALASSFLSQETTFPSITTPLPSMKATRERPSQFLKVSHTSGCCGWNVHCAISFDFSAWGSSIFLPPVSLPIFQESFEIRHAERPHRTKPIGEYPVLISFGMSRTWICASNSFVCPSVVSFL